MPAPSPTADTPPKASGRSDRPAFALWHPRGRPWLVAAGLALALFWAFWPTLATLAQRWSADPQYSHGFLVPLFALVVLWFRREQRAPTAWQPCLWGLPLLAAGLILHLVAGRMDFEPLAGFALLPTLAGVVLFVGGRGLLAWSWPAIAFLAFMLPLPFFLEVALAHPLRRLATLLSTYLLQTCGYPALHEGNIILIGHLRMGIVEACSGLGMLMTFFALATALVLVLQAPLTDRLALLLSAAPIAVLANVLRITVTAMAYYATGDETVQQNLHDLAGWLMMPLALGLFYLELCFINRLLLPRALSQDKPLALLAPTNHPDMKIPGRLETGPTSEPTSPRPKA